MAPRLVAGVPAPRRFFARLREGQVIATGLSVLDGTLASVQCMATTPRARRTGAASAVLTDIAGWAAALGAHHLYLQTEQSNTAAIALYEKAGFAVAGRYHVREMPGG